MKEEALTNTNIEHFHKRNVSILVAKLGNVPLTGQTILNECKKIKGLKFLGVFMVDQLPPLRAGTFVLNIDVSTGKGIHWTAGVLKERRFTYMIVLGDVLKILYKYSGIK